MGVQNGLVEFSEHLTNDKIMKEKKEENQSFATSNYISYNEGRGIKGFAMLR